MIVCYTIFYSVILLKNSEKHKKQKMICANLTIYDTQYREEWNRKVILQSYVISVSASF